MHSALLIDEILRNIFYLCSYHNRHRHTLVSASRSCKSWRDPALDFVWDRLTSFEPLLLLLPGVLVIDGEYSLSRSIYPEDLAVFRSYARRVKHVSYRRELKVHPNISRIFDQFLPLDTIVLPNLATMQISFPRCNRVFLPVHVSHSLRSLDFDLGFKVKISEIDSLLCHFLGQVGAFCPQLQQISLRGFASQRLNHVLSTFTNLQTLSLRLGHSLLPITLRTIMTFPRLLDLEVHAGHIESDEFDDVIGPQDYTPFRLLSKLHIRAKAPLIQTLFRHLQPNTLRYLHIDLEDDVPSAISWAKIFESINEKAGSLIRLRLEHHFEITDLQASPFADATQDATYNSVLANYGNLYMNLATVETLRNLKYLRHFVCDVTIPFVVNDKDIEKIVSWWPDIEYVDLGLMPEADELGFAWPTQMTTASLELFAKHCLKLKRLVLPMKICDISLPITPIDIGMPTNLL
ncbi:hypothetical protein BYT27DRAFT_7332722 [Phlegmacium glaucopus]|nr:hypothetical protein BYT27DRAFT_7332722 [Phlegmacium glaucopus]